MTFGLVEGLAAVHGLSAAAWFGALVYRTFFVDPKARRFFAEERDYEHYSLHLADGMRTVTLAALLVCGISGFALAGLKWPVDVDRQWLWGIKSGLWVIALGVFTYISWVYWPRRVFASGTDRRHMRRIGLVLSLVMIGIAASSFVMGQVARRPGDSLPAQFSEGMSARATLK